LRLSAKVSKMSIQVPAMGIVFEITLDSVIAEVCSRAWYGSMVCRAFFPILPLLSKTELITRICEVHVESVNKFVNTFFRGCFFIQIKGVVRFLAAKLFFWLINRLFFWPFDRLIMSSLRDRLDVINSRFF